LQLCSRNKNAPYVGGRALRSGPGKEFREKWVNKKGKEKGTTFVKGKRENRAPIRA